MEVNIKIIHLKIVRLPFRFLSREGIPFGHFAVGKIRPIILLSQLRKYESRQTGDLKTVNWKAGKSESRKLVISKLKTTKLDLHSQNHFKVFKPEKWTCPLFFLFLSTFCFASQ